MKLSHNRFNLSMKSFVNNFNDRKGQGWVVSADKNNLLTLSHDLRLT